MFIYVLTGCSLGKLAKVDGLTPPTHPPPTACQGLTGWAVVGAGIESELYLKLNVTIHISQR